MLKITITLPEPERLYENVQQQEATIKKAAQRALNKTVRWLRFHLARDVAAELDMKVSLIRPGLVIIGARQSHLTSLVGLPSKAGVVPATQLGTPQQTATGTQVGKRYYDKAFLATMPTGHRGVYKRRGRTRLPIREMVVVFTGRLAEHMMHTQETGKIQHQLQRIFERELRY